jgi:hypothetical protein
MVILSMIILGILIRFLGTESAALITSADEWFLYREPQSFVSFFCVASVDRHTSVSGDVLSADSYETRYFLHYAAGWYSGNFITPA